MGDEVSGRGMAGACIGPHTHNGIGHFLPLLAAAASAHLPAPLGGRRECAAAAPQKSTQETPKTLKRLESTPKRPNNIDTGPHHRQL